MSNNGHEDGFCLPLLNIIFFNIVLNFRGFHIVLSLDNIVTYSCSSEDLAKEEQMASDGAAHDSVTLYTWSSKNAKLKRI